MLISTGVNSGERRMHFTPSVKANPRIRGEDDPPLDPPPACLCHVKSKVKGKRRKTGSIQGEEMMITEINNDKDSKPEHKEADPSPTSTSRCRNLSCVCTDEEGLHAACRCNMQDLLLSSRTCCESTGPDRTREDRRNQLNPTAPTFYHYQASQQKLMETQRRSADFPVGRLVLSVFLP